MTQILDRPQTEVDVRTATEVRPRPIELDRELRQLPPVGEPPGRFRWLGWLLGLAAVAAVAWLVIAEITAEDAPVASPATVVVDGITADPKARTPVVTPEMVNQSIRSGIPGDATLTQIVTFGHSPGRSLEDATVNPNIFWATPPTYATNMEEATVSPRIYEAEALRQLELRAEPGVYWRHGEVIDEMTYGVHPPIASPLTDTVTSVLDGAYWRYDLVLEERPMLPEGLDLTFGVWPAMYANPAAVAEPTLLDLGVPDWPPTTMAQVPTSVPNGGHMNIMI
ncbi:MAG: hypothetical protein HKN91_06750 [Acidimicrobiia bacterium]|nr:hypothetical protein [Acidimicrobiia bacterium]